MPIIASIKPSIDAVAVIISYKQMNTILKSYIPTINALAKSFGPCCEIVLHDLSQPESSVVYVSGSNVTNRQVGQSFDHLIKQVLLNKQFKDDYVSNYTFSTEDGKVIKSSSALIRGEGDEIVGMLCVNFDITGLESFQKNLACFLSTLPDPGAQKEKEADENVMSIIDQLIARIVGEAGTGSLSRKRCVELVRFMDEKGIFLVRGAIDKVAARLGVSKVTIYSYLDEAKGKTRS